MKIQERDVRIKNIISEIEEGEIDLRPDFQRGEVWTNPRKKLLIDSIFRSWHIPPIHIVHVERQPSEVLDGQQRLTAIRDFKQNRFAIDGFIEPADEDINRLNGMRYADLNSADKEKFDRYNLKIYEITEYNHGEPGELFHRLNQSVKLTSAEQRNAFFGEIRDEISHLVHYMSMSGVERDVLGFGNSRMAYNDLLIRICFYLEAGSIRAVVNDKSLTLRFRARSGFEARIIDSVKCSIDFMKAIKKEYGISDFSLTKASSFSWMYFFANQSYLSGNKSYKQFVIAFYQLESARTAIKNNSKIPAETLAFFAIPEKNLREFLLLYIERSSSRVTAVSSIAMRDLSICFSCYRAGFKFKSEPMVAKDLTCLAKNLSSSKVDVKELIESSLADWKGDL